MLSLMRIVIVDWNGENIGATFGSIFKLISRIWRHHCDNLLRPRLTWPTCNLCCFVIVVLYEWLWVKWRVSYKRQKLLTFYEHMVLPAGFFVVSLLFIFCCVFLFVFFLSSSCVLYGQCCWNLNIESFASIWIIVGMSSVWHILSDSFKC